MKQKANISIELYASNVTIGFDLHHDLDLEFSRSNMEFAISQSKMVWLQRNKKHPYQLMPQMWPSDLTFTMTLTLSFQGKIWNLLYLSQKWCNCNETKSKHINWTLGLKCDHRVWHWPWPWLRIFKVKFIICYISAKNGLIATKWKVHIYWTEGLNNHQVWPWPWPWKVMYKDLLDSDQGDFRWWCAIN